MKANMGKTDRVLRLVLGAAIIFLGVYYESWWGLVGLIPIITSFISWCPLYVPFGLTTTFKRKES